jgi:hypothetical protein
MDRIRLILVGAVLGLAWAAALRGYMMQLAGPTSTFTFSGTFGIILPTGTLVGALLGWAEYQRRAGRWYPLLIGAPLLLAILPSLLTAGLDLAPVGLAGPQRHHTVRRLGRHAGLVPVRSARPGLLHTNARTRSHSGTGRIPVGPPGSKPVYWDTGTAHLLPRLLRLPDGTSRTSGPLFLASRRPVPARRPAPRDICPHTGRARLG